MVGNWLREAAERLGGGQENRCQAGHGSHDSRVVNVVLDGETAVPDLPAIPSEHRRTFQMAIWDWERYQNYAGLYCTGQDEVSKAIDHQGIWEGYETRLAVELLDSGPPEAAVIDFGAHVGWFTLLAVASFRPVLAVEADAENLALLEANAKRVARGHLVVPCRAWVSPASRPLPRGEVPVRLVKIDIEGQEAEAVRVCEPLLRERLIDYLLVEASPEFPEADTRSLVERLLSLGYAAYLVPTKGETVEPDALSSCRARPVVPKRCAELVPNQRTLLFERVTAPRSRARRGGAMRRFTSREQDR